MFENNTVQGEKVSYANIEIKFSLLGGLMFRTADVPAIDWQDDVEIVDVPGTGSNPVGYSIGAYTKSASMTLYLAKFYELQNALAAVPVGAKGICLVPFDIIVQWTPLSLPSSTVLTAKIAGARMIGRQASNAPGAEAATRVVPLFPSYIEDGGKRLIRR